MRARKSHCARLQHFRVRPEQAHLPVPEVRGRTLVEGELCKICKMTMEHPQDMVRCERCGLMNNRSIKFCRKCGSKLDKDHT